MTQNLQALLNRAEINVKAIEEKREEAVKIKEDVLDLIDNEAKKLASPEGMLERAITILKNIMNSEIEIETNKEIDIDVEGEYVSIWKDISISVDADEAIAEYDEAMTLINEYEDLSPEEE